MNLNSDFCTFFCLACLAYLYCTYTAVIRHPSPNNNYFPTRGILASATLDPYFLQGLGVNGKSSKGTKLQLEHKHTLARDRPQQ